MYIAGIVYGVQDNDCVSSVIRRWGDHIDDGSRRI